MTKGGRTTTATSRSGVSTRASFQSPSRSTTSRTTPAKRASNEDGAENIAVENMHEAFRGDYDSEVDEGLTDYDDTGSDKTEGSHFDSTSNYTYIAESCCRATTKVKTVEGIHVLCVCGRSSTNCKRHLSQRKKGLRMRSGYYSACVQKSGGITHGRGGTYKSREDYDAERDEEREEMRRMIASTNEETEDTDGTTTLSDGENIATTSKTSSTGTRTATGASSDKTSPTKTSFKLGNSTKSGKEGNKSSSRSKATDIGGGMNPPRRKSVPYIWFGLEDSSRNRIIVDSLKEAGIYETAGYQVRAVFDNEDEARRWRDADLSDDENKMTSRKKGSSVNPRRGSKTHRSRGKSSRNKDSSSQSSGQSSEQSNETASTSRASKRKSRKKKHSKKNRKSRKKKYKSSSEEYSTSDDRNSSSEEDKDTSSSEDEDSFHTADGGPSDDPSDSSSSEEESDDESDDSSYHNKRKQRKKKAKRKKEKKSSRRTKSSRKDSKRAKRKKDCIAADRRRRRKVKAMRTSHHGKDPSTGNKDRAYGMDIMSEEIGLAAGPKDIPGDKVDRLFEAAVDVSSLPGTLLSKYARADAVREADTAGAVEVTQALIAGLQGQKARVFDVAWKNHRRHGLKVIKDGTSLEEAAVDVGDAESEAFQAQEHGIRQYMIEEWYDDNAISNYLYNGFLPKITSDSFKNYYNLIIKARELHVKHSTRGGTWDTNPGNIMITFHANKLWSIRRSSRSKRELVLRTYTYLRDAASTKFFTPELTEGMWNHLSILDQRVEGGDSKGGHPDADKDKDKEKEKDKDKGKKLKCSHCQSLAVHQRLGLAIGRRACPFKELSTSDARKAAKDVAKEIKDSPEANVMEIVKKKLEEY